MKLAFTTLGCPDWDLATIAKTAGKLGYAGVEMRTHDDGNHLSPDTNPKKAAAIRKMFEDEGSAIFSIMGYSKFAISDPAERQKNVDLALRLIDLAANIGAGYMRIFGGKLEEGTDPKKALQLVADTIRPVCRRAEEAGLQLAIETHDDWCKGEIISTLVETTGSPALGIVWDYTNAVTGGADTLESSFTALKKYIKYSHVKDATKSPDGKWTYVIPGTGEIGVPKVVELLRTIDFDGFLSFEWEKKWHPELANPEEAFPACAENLRKILGT